MVETQKLCHALQADLEGQKQARRAELEVWSGRYSLLRGECDDLQEEVIYLQEALKVTRAALIAAEQLCRSLEAQLDAVHNLQDAPPRMLSLVAALDETDRHASVPDLVAVISNLESRTHGAMASELVSSVSQSRAVEEVMELLSALE